MEPSPANLSKRQVMGSVAALFAVLVMAVIQVNLQFGKLVESIEISETQMYDMFDEIDEAVNEIADSPSASSPNAAVWLREDIRKISKRYKTKVAIAGDAVADISLLPWNISHRSLQRAYLLHSDAWVQYLNDRSIDPSTLKSDAIETTWEGFCSQATRSSPLLAFGRFDTRLTRICAKGSD